MVTFSPTETPSLMPRGRPCLRQHGHRSYRWLTDGKADPRLIYILLPVLPNVQIRISRSRFASFLHRSYRWLTDGKAGLCTLFGSKVGRPFSIKTGACVTHDREFPHSRLNRDEMLFVILE